MILPLNSHVGFVQHSSLRKMRPGYMKHLWFGGSGSHYFLIRMWISTYISCPHWLADQPQHSECRVCVCVCVCAHTHVCV